MAAIFTSYAQVGVNTLNPQGILHIDPIGNTSGSANGNDDVVVDTYGNVGLGVLAPSAKMDIESSTEGAIKIVDGTQKQRRALMATDPNGKAEWANVVGGWTVALIDGNLPASNTYDYIAIPFNLTYSSDSSVGILNPAIGQVIVPYTGAYRISINGYARNTRLTNAYYVTMIRLFRNGINTWGPHLMGHTTLGDMTLGFTNFFALNAGDALQIFNDQTPNTNAYSNSVRGITFIVEFLQ